MSCLFNVSGVGYLLIGPRHVQPSGDRSGGRQVSVTVSALRDGDCISAS